MAKKNTLGLWIGGAAGDGNAAAGESFMQICARSGLYAYAYNSYQSLIRGGHVLFQVAISPTKAWVHPDAPDILIALNQDTIEREAKDAIGGVLYNSDKLKLDPAALKPGAKALGLPIMTLASNPLMQNTVAVGALIKLVGADLKLYEEMLLERFAKKSKEIQEANLAAARAGYEYAAKNFPDMGIELPKGKGRKAVLTGNQAFGAGAVVAGCKFYSAYPMTPASGVMHWLAPRAAKHGVVFKQAEDELAAMNMAVGAGHAGVRAATGTSGGGFALMTEAIGMAGMIEAPVVVITVQRGGPSTGLPTKTEQGDLFQVLGASQGDYPRAVIAPTTVEDAYKTMGEAFNLAEKYQMPVLVVSDLMLSEHLETVDDFELALPIDRGVWAQPRKNGTAEEPFLRYVDTDTGVSPRAVPGQEGLLFVAGTDEHDEKGDLISDVHTDPVKRKKMMEKRQRKLQFVAKDFKPTKIEGPADADLTLVCWGSTYTLVRHLMETVNAKGGKKVNILCVRYMAPFATADVAAALKAAKKTLAIELNFTGQLCRLIRMETGIEVKDKLLSYDGEPIPVEKALKKISEVLNG